MKKILIICASLRIGGAERVAADIALCADPGAYEVHYVVFDSEVGAYEPELEAIGCRVFHLAPPSSGFRAYLRSLRELIRTYHYDVIHAHTMFNIGWAMLAGRLYGVPVRVSHAHSALRERKPPQVRLYEAVMRGLIRCCATDYVACGVAAGQRLYGKRTFAKKGQLILNGIDTQRFAFDGARREALRAELGLSDRFVIGHAGHLAPVKNQIFLLERMPELLRRRPDAFSLLLGEGASRPLLEQRIRELGLQDAVRLTGNVRNVPDYLSAMDVFAFPSLYEGMPLSILEVQANGLPCVISDRVPRDVFLTDLLCPLPLEQPDAWVEALCRARRETPERYAGTLRAAGVDTRTAMGKLYEIYEGAGL